MRVLSAGHLHHGRSPPGEEADTARTDMWHWRHVAVGGVDAYTVAVENAARAR